MRSAAVDYMGEENVVDLDIWMAAEDFAYYTHEIPGCFYCLEPEMKQRALFPGFIPPTFDIDEAALETACGLMAWLAVSELNE